MRQQLLRFETQNARHATDKLTLIRCKFLSRCFVILGRGINLYTAASKLHKTSCQERTVTKICSKFHQF